MPRNKRGTGKGSISTGNRLTPISHLLYVLLPDHFHYLWTLPENDNNYSTRWQLIKSYFSRRCQNKYKGMQTASRLNKDEQGIWQRRFWEHQIKNENDLVWHIDYIHYNPVKHGLVNPPITWLYSSFHRYIKQGNYDADWEAGCKIEFDAKVGYE